MKRKLFTGIAAVLLISGLMMLIAPRISNRIGEQIAHSTIDDFKALKSKSTYDEPTEKKESSEESTKRDDSEAESLRVRQVEEKGLNPESSNSSDNVPKIDFDRLFSDSIAYNENLKKHQICAEHISLLFLS